MVEIGRKEKNKLSIVNEDGNIVVTNIQRLQDGKGEKGKKTYEQEPQRVHSRPTTAP